MPDASETPQHDEGVGGFKPFHRSNCSFPLITLNAVKGVAIILAKAKTENARCFGKHLSMTRVGWVMPDASLRSA
ncbi:MAG: hypothetical protein VB108_09670 [Anaerolineaceae bacterium]|nr:hypothetical protein [Anaerolineaceae bacterium]